jgi:hypothetical protein
MTETQARELLEAEARRGPTLAETAVHPAAPADALLAPGEELLLDFGRETVGRLHVTLQAPAPSTLAVRYGEDHEEARRDRDYTGNWYHLPGDRFAPGSEPATFTSVGRRAFRFVRLTVPADAPAPVRVLSASATLVHHPVTLRAAFECSDPLLNDAWRISEYTTRLCMQRYFEDGVKRDGLLWIGDYRVQFLCAAYLYPDAAASLSLRSLALMALSQFGNGRLPAAAIRAGAHQHPHNIEYMLDFSGEQQGEAWLANWRLLNYDADFVSSVREFHDLTGDDSALRALWPTVRRLLPHLLSADPRTVDHKEFITDTQPDSESWWASRGALAAQLCEAARDVGVLAGRVGDAGVGERCRAYLDDAPARLAPFFDAEAHAFRDEPAGTASRVSWHANTFAVLSGAVAGDDATRLLRAVQARPDARYTTAGFMEFHRLHAQFAAGLTPEALAEMRRYWGHMLRHGATTCWDVCDPDAHPQGIERPETHAMSHCHGWSAGPAYLLPAHVLGVRPAAPGFAAIEVAPQLGGLAWARGAVPTPHGDIEVHLEAGHGGTVRLPAGITTAALLTPDGARRPLRPGHDNTLTAADIG